MTKKCPKCGNEFDAELTTCPTCGYSLTDTTVDTEEAKTTSTNIDFETQENDQHENQLNENIEWSELKDMSLGHVMELFGESPEEESNDDKKEEPTEDSLIVSDSEDVSGPEASLQEGASEETHDLVEETTPATEAMPTHSTEEELATDEAVTLEEPTEETTTVEAETAEVSETVKSEEAALTEISGTEVIPATSEEETFSQPPIEDQDVTPNETLQAYIQAHRADTEMSENQSEETAESQEVENSSEVVLTETETPTESISDSKEGLTSAESLEAPSETDATEEKVSDSGVIPPMNETGIAQPAPAPKKPSKKVAFVVLAVVLLAGGSAWAYHDQTQKAAAQEAAALTKKTDTLKNELAAFYTTKEQVFIKPDMVTVSPEKLSKQVAEIKDSEEYSQLNKQIQTLKDKQQTIRQINQLFEAPIVNGNELKPAILAADQPISVKKVTGNDPFDQLMNQAIDQANQQYNQLQKAKKAVEVIYKDGKTTNQLNRDTYQAAKAEVDKVTSDKLKKELVKQVTTADQALTKVEEEQKRIAEEQAAQAAAEQAKQAEEQAKQAAAAKKENAKKEETAKTEANGYTAPNSDGVYTSPLYAPDPADVADSNNPAWTWAPGVKEKVLDTVIARGYVVPGGYSLEPAKIVNGEGYYNLYATNNQSKLLEGTTEKNVHMYLVTINAKTGWFKGNASRNAGQ
ncbi:cell division site-positioning protein MapZ family protein [Enterococcus faecalis]|uniref:cell division site-positioning protein MapZ family protein n=1 Tax=Enterococcus faecalis TaxID=1351 RepID=UPI0024572E07|nr:cell division site-positioning protein MapZ family protein [Enterococcus faecalis]MDH5039953.1 cell division site-positioning protein MapZ family protein [Enterococcus faecalis]